MEDEQERATPEQMDELARALHVITQPALRRAFLANPLKTLEEHGAGGLPAGLVNALADMTYEELKVVARLVSYEQGIVIGTTEQGLSLRAF